MTAYLNASFDYTTDELVGSYDDLPVWSSVPGNLLLEHLHYSENQTVVDIGPGTGFPLLPMAARFGSSSRVYGVDLWESALKRVKEKIRVRNVRNVELYKTNASEMPFSAQSVDMVTSNLGINNFEQPDEVVQECFRILKPGGYLYLTSNLVGTFSRFYDEFVSVVKEVGSIQTLNQLQQHVDARATSQRLDSLFTQHGFLNHSTIETIYSITYCNGSAFLNDYFIIMAFLPSWKEIVPQEQHEQIFSQLEDRLNKIAEEENGLKLDVPIALKVFQRDA
ncbi:MAG: class I SAM-dependent methyltransferase [Bacteroidia bacterium]|nr:class I SAM-dependent methyltransferase [Bacteroidia bacterium]